MTASVIGVASSPKSASRSRALLELALAALERQGAGPSRLVDLATLPADALLGRRDTAELQVVADFLRDLIASPGGMVSDAPR